MTDDKVVAQHFFARLTERLGLRFPALFFLFAALTVADLIVPDAIPLIDEILLALVTLLLGLLRERAPKPPSE